VGGSNKKGEGKDQSLEQEEVQREAWCYEKPFFAVWNTEEGKKREGAGNSIIFPKGRVWALVAKLEGAEILAGWSGKKSSRVSPRERTYPNCLEDEERNVSSRPRILET